MQLNHIESKAFNINDYRAYYFLKNKFLLHMKSDLIQSGKLKSS